MSFKRNQVEEALSNLFEPKAKEPSPELRSRLKRLLETDRALGRSLRSSNSLRANYAFFSDEQPGRGFEVLFSGYEAFALLVGFQLMAHGWTQGVAVSILRSVRQDMERQHTRILRLDPEKLFDEAEIRRNAKPGGMAFSNTAPVLLVIVSDSSPSAADRSERFSCAVVEGEAAATRWGWEKSAGVGGYSMFEVATMSHKLANELKRTEPRTRGRTS